MSEALQIIWNARMERRQLMLMRAVGALMATTLFLTVAVAALALAVC